MDSKSLHRALAVTNIKTHIPLILEKDSTHYMTWKTLFQVHCQAFEVQHHLAPKIPVTPPPASSDPASAANAEAAVIAAEALWSRLDAIVLQWIYATISQPLLHIILQPGQTAFEAWTAVESEFSDNQNTRAIFLGQEFANLSLENFASMDEYWQQVEHLADQLASVGSPVDNRMLLLKLFTGVTKAYDSISTVLPSRGFMRVEPDLPDNNHELYADQPPSMSSTGRMKNPEPQYLQDGQREVVDEPNDQPPSRTDLHHGPGNSITGGNDNRGLSQTDYSDQAPSHSALVHDNNSTPAFSDGSSYESAPSHSAMVHENQSNPGGYPEYADPQELAGYSIPGRHFKQ